jgi:hypothetical protein
MMAVTDLDGRGMKGKTATTVSQVRTPPSVRAAQQRQAARVRQAVVARFMRRMSPTARP